MQTIRIFRIFPDAKIPIRASDGAVGFDVYAYHELDRITREHKSDLPITIQLGEAVLIGIGVKFALPWGYVAHVMPRSGLACRNNVELSNSPGTVDPDFRGQTSILLRNRGEEPFTIEKGMRIAQLVISKVDTPTFVEVDSEDDLGDTRRGTGGFGSTGLTGDGLGISGYEAIVKAADVYHMRIVFSTAAQSNCMRGCQRDEDGKYLLDDHGQPIGQRRRFGCIIVQDPMEITRRTVASGYNCQYPGSKLCRDVGCLRDEQGIPSGEKIEVCRAVHAEQLAIVSASRSGVSIEGATMYVNSEPCLICAKMIACTGIQALVVLQEGYGDGERHGLKIVEEAGIEIRTITKEELE